MSRLASFTIYGQYLNSQRYEAVLELIRNEHGSVAIDGMLQGAVAYDDGFDFVSEPLATRDEFVVAGEMFESGRLMSIYASFEIEGVTRFYNFNPHFPDRLLISLQLNRKTLADGVTDFNWHYLYWLPRVQQTVLRPYGVEFCDTY